MIAYDDIVAIVPDDHGRAMIADDDVVAMVADDHGRAMITDDRRHAMVADNGTATAPVTVASTCPLVSNYKCETG